MLYDASCNCSYVPLHCSRNKIKEKERKMKNESRKIDKRKIKSKSNIRV